MMRTHLALDGSWETCPTDENCASPIHVDLSIEEAKQLPEYILEQLAEASDPPHEITEYGSKRWLDAENNLHRSYGLPAGISEDGSRVWRQHGINHRDGDKPALTLPDGSAVWRENGENHRAGGLPAFIGADGEQSWYTHGLKHRDNDLPAIIKADGTREWFIEGQRHRVGGPARIYPDGGSEWWESSKLIRSLHADGTPVEAYT